jgi:predicted ATPase
VRGHVGHTGPLGQVVPIFGRHEIVEEIERVLQEARNESRGRLLLLVGTGGVGRTTILRTASASAASAGYLVLAGRCLPTEVPRPFGLVEDLLKSAQSEGRPRGRGELPPTPSLPLYAVGVSSGEDLEPAPDTGFEDEPREVAEADHLLKVLANPTERVDADRSSLFGRVVDFFLALAQRRPIFVAIDDLQFADESSLEFLRQLGTFVGQGPLVVTATCLPFAEAAPRTVGTLEKIAAGPLAATMWLRAMTETELHDFVRWLLNGRESGRDELMRWFSQTEGNPLFTEYLVRASTGFGRPVAGERESARPDLGELLLARVKSLSEPELRVLVHAAVLGKEFDFRTLDIACAQEEEGLSEVVDRLVQVGLLREKGDEVYEFVSERVRVDVYSQLTETRRRLLHRKVAHALVTRDGITTANLYELARQFYLGRDDLQAIELNRRAAAAAAHAFAFDTAAVHLERALECQRRLTPRDLPTELRMLVELGRYFDELGDYPRSEEVLTDAVARARSMPKDGTDLALALLGLAQTKSDLSQFAQARDLAQEAFRLLEGGGHKRGAIAAHRVLGVACWRLGDLDAAEQHQRAALALAETEGSPAEHGHALIDLANTFSLRGLGRVNESLALYQTAAGIFADIHDPSAEARVLMNRALLHRFAGQHDEALRVMVDALAAAERSRSPIWIGYCSVNLAQFYTEAKEAAKARPLIERAAALLDPVGDQLAHQQVVMIRGMICELEGNLPLAEQTYLEALALARQLDLSAEVTEMLYRLAALAQRSGSPHRARQLLAESKGAGLERLHPDLVESAATLEREILATPARPQG